MSAGQRVTWTSQLMAERSAAECRIALRERKIAKMQIEIRDDQYRIQAINNLCSEAVSVVETGADRCPLCCEQYWVKTVTVKIVEEYCGNPECARGEERDGGAWESWQRLTGAMEKALAAPPPPQRLNKGVVLEAAELREEKA